MFADIEVGEASPIPTLPTELIRILSPQDVPKVRKANSLTPAKKPTPLAVLFPPKRTPELVVSFKNVL